MTFCFFWGWGQKIALKSYVPKIVSNKVKVIKSYTHVKSQVLAVLLARMIGAIRLLGLEPAHLEPGLTVGKNRPKKPSIYIPLV